MDARAADGADADDAFEVAVDVVVADDRGAAVLELEAPPEVLLEDDEALRRGLGSFADPGACFPWERGTRAVLIQAGVMSCLVMGVSCGGEALMTALSRRGEDWVPRAFEWFVMSCRRELER